MKIRTKLAIEVIFLVSLVGMVSFIALINTKQVQDSFLGLSTQTMPILDSLKDMRYASTQITSTTMEIILIKEESRTATGQQLLDLEEELELELFQIENAKALFNQAFSHYSVLMAENFPENMDYNEAIAKKWNSLISTSNKMISMKNKAAGGNEILKLKDEFENAQQSINLEIDNALSFIASNIDERKDVVASLVDNTTLTILITLNLFIAGSLGIRYFILKSISNPLLQLRKATREIALGNFIKTGSKNNDEISELGRDIDLMSENLKKLNETIVKTERLSSIGNLASRLAHDLRNPLSVIKNSMGILSLKLDHIMDEKTSLQLARVGRAVARMSHQIDDVLDYVNVAELQLEPSSLSTVVESAVLGTSVPEYVKVNTPKHSATIICDPFKLEIAFSNLINNAIQAIDGEGEITIRIKELQNDVVIELEDSGPGIPESALSKIFEPLFTTKQVGTGLGLASCKSIIDKHGGTIYASNNPTKFTINLPKKQTEPAKKTLEDTILTE